jgi:hypothetical protein
VPQRLYLSFKTLYSRRKNLGALFSINIFKNKIDCCSIMNTVGLRVSSKQIRESPPLISLMSQDLGLQQGASQLQTAFAYIWTNISSPLRIHFPLLNPTEFLVPVMSLACYLYYFII